MLDRANYDNVNIRGEWQGAPDDNGAGLNDLLRVLRRRSTLFMASFLLLSVLTGAYALLKPVKYTANAVVMVEPKVSDDVFSGMADQRLSAAEEIRISTVVEVMKSRNLAEKIALALADDIGEEARTEATFIDSARSSAKSLFQSVLGGGDRNAAFISDDDRRFKEATDRVLNDIKVRRVSKSRIIEIAASARSPEDSVRKANAQIEIYIDTMRRERHQTRKKRVENLEGLVEEARRELLNADLNVAKYMRENNLISASQDATVLNRIARLESALTEATTESISRKLNRLMQEEAEIEDRLAKLSVIYGPGYPEIVDLREQLFAKELEISTERQRVLTRTRNARAQIDESAAGLQNEIRSVRRQHFAALEANAGLKELEREAQARLSQSNSLSEQLQRAKTALYQHRDDIKLMAKPVVPATPANSGTIGLLAIGSVGSLFLSALLAFAVEAVDTNVRSSEHVRALMGAPTLSMIPRAPGRKVQADNIREYLADNTQSDFTEAVRNLYLELISSGVSHTPRIVVVTSVLPDEGKTIVANGLSAMAGFFDQRAITIDLDNEARGRATVAPQLEAGDLPTDESGTALYPMEGPRAVSLRDLPGQLEDLRERWDIIIVEAPPILKSRDAKVLASYADDVLVVMEWAKTPAGAVKAAREVFSGIDVGVILNRVNLMAHARLAYGDSVQYAQQSKKNRFI